MPHFPYRANLYDLTVWPPKYKNVRPFSLKLIRLTFIYRIFGNFVLRATAAVKLFSEIICVYVHFYEWLLISLFEKNVINII